MKRKLSLFLLFPLALLASCQTIGKRLPLARNGDLSSSSEDSYQAVCVEQNVDRLIERMDNGETVAFLFAQTTCSHCLAWQPTFTQFLKDENYEVVLYENGLLSYSEWSRTVLALQDYFHDTETIRQAAPLLFVADKKSFTYVGTGLSESELHNAFKAQGEEGHITHFTKVDAFTAFLTENPTALVYLADTNAGGVGSAFFVSTLFPKANSANKPLVYLDFFAMDSANQNAVLAYFGLDNFTPLLGQNKLLFNLNNENEMAAATSLVETYCH